MADYTVKLDNNNHSVFLLYYHLILVVKYRRKVFSDQMSQYAKDIFKRREPVLWQCSRRFCVYAVRFLCTYDVFKLSANSLLTDELSAEAMFSVADKLFKKG